MDKDTILFIMHMPPPVHGAAMVGKYIHDSKLINETFDCHYINLSTAKDLTDIGKAGIKKALVFIRLLLNIRKQVKTLRPELVYVTPNAKGKAFYKDFIVVQMLKSFGCKVVCHYHNKGVKTRQDRWLDDWLYRRFFKRIKVILLVETLYDDVRKYVKREDVFICPNGIPETGKPVMERKENKVPHILFLSNLLVDKGVLVLLDALQILKERGCSFVCDFVGGETAEIDAARFSEEVEKRQLNTVAVYKGRKYGKDKEDALEASDIFVFPTFYGNETFGLVNLEAMQHHKPVISTNEGGIPDIVKDGVNGIICEKENKDSLALAIQRLLEDEVLRKEMGNKGYRLFKEKYTLARFESNMSALLTEINSGGVKINIAFYHGKKYGEEKSRMFDEADIFVFPTSYANECFPLVLLEAMQHGIACVSTDEGGISDIIEDGVTGLIVQKNDAACLADTIERLMSAPNIIKQMGDAGRKKYERQFTLGTFENNLSELLKHAIIN